MNQLIEDAPVFLSVIGLVWLLLLIVVMFVERNNRSRVYIAVLIFGLSALGVSAGFTGGMSRTGVVGDIIPAALVFVGGVSAYLFGVDQSKGAVVSLGAAAFALAIVSGYAAGAGNRVAPERYEAAREICYEVFSNPEVLNDKSGLCFATMIFWGLCGKIIHEQEFEIFLMPTNSNAAAVEAFRQSSRNNFTGAMRHIAEANCAEK